MDHLDPTHVLDSQTEEERADHVHGNADVFQQKETEILNVIFSWKRQTSIELAVQSCLRHLTLTSRIFSESVEISDLLLGVDGDVVAAVDAAIGRHVERSTHD